MHLRAGTGYWAKLLADRGVDVAAYDERPPRHAAWKHHPVHRGGLDVLEDTDHHRRALLLVCPHDGDDGDPWDAKALAAYRGDTLVHVGAFDAPGCPSPNTSEAFQALVQAEWTVERRLSPVANLASRFVHDTLTVWSRKRAASSEAHS